MKKLISIIAVFAIILMTLAGCGNEKTDKEKDAEAGDAAVDDGSLKLGVDYTAGDLQFTLFEVITSEDIETVSGKSSYYSAESGNVYVDVILKATNTGNQDFSIDDEAITGHFKDSDNKYDDLIVGTEDDDSYFDIFSPIAAKTSCYLHIGFQVPSDTKTGKAVFSINKKSFELNYDSSVEISSRTANATAIELGTDYTAGDVKFSLYKVTTSEELKAVGSRYHYDCDSGMNYVDVVLTLTNNGKTDFTPDDDIACFFKTDDNAKYNDMLIATESGTDLDTYDSIKALSTVKVHLGYKVPTDVTTGKAYFTIGDDTFVYDYDASVKVSSAVAINMNEDTTVDGKGTFKITKITTTDKILPPDTSSYYTYYSVDNPDSDTYLVVYCDLTNSSSSAVDIDDMIVMKVTFDGGYEYDGSLVIEDKDGGGFNSYEDISPLETRNGVIMFEIPKQIKDSSYELSIYFMGNEYTLTK